MEQWLQRTSGTVATEDQWNSRYRGSEEQLVQRTSGTVGTEEQWNSRYRGAVEKLIQRTRLTVGTHNSCVLVFLAWFAIRRFLR